VREYVLGQPLAREFLDVISRFLTFSIPAYQAEGKSRLTVAVGCTGGYHRSVVISEALAQMARDRDLGAVSVWHRELERA
jgi:UPF0042 nucleotide-binding protein